MKSQSTISTKALNEMEDIYLCPITLNLMDDPYDLPCGHTFEFKAICDVLQKHKSCPMCKRVFLKNDLKPNLIAQQSIHLLKKFHERKTHQKQIKQIQLYIEYWGKKIPFKAKVGYTYKDVLPLIALIFGVTPKVFEQKYTVDQKWKKTTISQKHDGNTIQVDMLMVSFFQQYVDKDGCIRSNCKH